MFRNSWFCLHEYIFLHSFLCQSFSVYVLNVLSKIDILKSRRSKIQELVLLYTLSLHWSTTAKMPKFQNVMSILVLMFTNKNKTKSSHHHLKLGSQSYLYAQPVFWSEVNKGRKFKVGVHQNFDIHLFSYLWCASPTIWLVLFYITNQMLIV